MLIDDYFQVIHTFPHHKHDGDETNVVAASAPTLADVLKEIESLLDLP